MAATYFLLRGIEPPDLRAYPDPVKIAYWGWVAELGLKAKDAELAKGLDKDGRPLRPIRPKTAKYRRSAMTPTGKGDPSAPPLMPGRSLSRTRSLLAARARKSSAEFYWRFDPYTHDTWGKILRFQADKGRDVFGLSRQATAKVQAQALVRWNAWKRKHEQPQRQIVAMPPVTPKVVPFARTGTGPVAVTGSTGTRFVTFGEGQTAESFAKSVREGRNSGFMTHDQLVRHYRQSIARPRFKPGASPAAKKGAERLHPQTGAVPGSTNRVITTTFGTIKGRPLPFTAPPAPPKPTPIVKPKSSPVGSAFTGAAHDLVPTMKAIEGIHTIGSHKPTPTPVTGAIALAGKRGVGAFVRERVTGTAVRIEVKEDGPTRGLTLAHEIGHYLEQTLIPGHNSGRRDWAADPTLRPFADAVRATEAYQNLTAMRGKTEIDRGGLRHAVDPGRTDYLLSNAEVWARAYAQWVATKSRSVELIEQLDRTRDPAANLYHVAQWGDHDFKPVAAALELIFGALQWLI